MVHGAEIQDRDGAPAVFAAIPRHFPRLRQRLRQNGADAEARSFLIADGAYAGPKLEGALKRIGRWSLEIVNRPAGVKGFQLLPRRWVVDVEAAPAQPPGSIETGVRRWQSVVIHCLYLATRETQHVDQNHSPEV